MLFVHSLFVCFFFFKQKTAYEMRISDWSSDVCSSDLGLDHRRRGLDGAVARPWNGEPARGPGLRRGLRRGGLAVARPAGRRRQPGARHRPGAAGKRGVASSEERRVGEGWVSTFRSGWSRYKEKKNKQTIRLT